MKKQIIADNIAKWSSPCLLSNAKHMLYIKPTKNGWKQETVMEFDGLPNAVVADRLTALALDSIDTHIMQHPEQFENIMPYMAHALVSIVHRFKIHIDHETLTAFPKEERDFIQKQDKIIYKALQHKQWETA